MRRIALATGVSVGIAAATPGLAHHKAGHGDAAVSHASPQGYANSGNPHAAGGPANPGVGNPFNAY